MKIKMQNDRVAVMSYTERDSLPQSQKYIFDLLPVVPFIHLDCFGVIRLRVTEIKQPQYFTVH